MEETGCAVHQVPPDLIISSSAKAVSLKSIISLDIVPIKRFQLRPHLLCLDLLQTTLVECQRVFQFGVIGFQNDLELTFRIPLTVC